MLAQSDLGLMVPEVHLFHRYRRFKRFVSKLSGKEHDFLKAPALTFYEDGIAAVYIGHRGKKDTETALLVHEAYHVAYRHMEFLGEDDYGEETMAYLVQTVAHGLVRAHRRWRRGKRDSR